MKGHFSSDIECKKKSSCLQELLDMKKWYNVKIVSDGDCFFRTIAKHCEFEGIQIDPIVLRNKIVRYIEKRIEHEWRIPEKEREILSSIIFKGVSNDEKKEELREKLNALKTEGIYERDEFDILVEYAAHAINMTLNIYSIDSNIRISHHVPSKSLIEINLMYVNRNHYELLYPNDIDIYYERHNKTGIKEIPIDKYNIRWDKYSEARIESKQRSYNTLKYKSLEKALRNIENEERKEERKTNHTLKRTPSLEKALKNIENAESKTNHTLKRTTSFEKALKNIENAERKTLKRTTSLERALKNIENSERKTLKRTTSLEKALQNIEKAERNAERNANANFEKALKNMKIY